ncbi:hypothetical protein L7F22_047435 [Adiantum nelumboides]|nr:hypothetical protein [Adiantum nelumboides]
MVVRLPQGKGGFPLLIGRPWLRHTKALHDWGSDSMWISNPSGSRQSIKLEEGIDPSITQSAPTIQFVADTPPTHFSDDELLEWLAAAKGISCYGITIQRSCGKLEPDDLVSPSVQLSTSTKASQSSAQMFQRRFLPSPIIDISLRAPKCLKRREGYIEKCRPLTPWVLASSLMTFALLYFIALGPAVLTVSLLDVPLQSPQGPRKQVSGIFSLAQCASTSIKKGYLEQGSMPLGPVAHHGIPRTVSRLAYVPAQPLLTIGTLDSLLYSPSPFAPSAMVLAVHLSTSQSPGPLLLDSSTGPSFFNKKYASVALTKPNVAFNSIKSP